MNAVIHGTRQIEPGTITNASIAAAAAIAYSKLNLTGSIVNADIVSVAWSKITGTPTTLAGYGITSPLPVDQGGTGTATAFTAGSVVFAGASGVYAQDNANLFWDDTNNRLGIGTSAPQHQLDVYRSGEAILQVRGNRSGADSDFADWIFFNDAAGAGALITARRTGADDNISFRIKTISAGSTVPAVAIRHDGNFGIGTTDPGNKLSVEAINDYIAYNNTGAAAGGFKLKSGGTDKGYFGVASGAGTGVAGTSGGDIFIRAENQKIIFSTNTGTTAHVVLSGANVGVGVTSPTAALHLKAGTATANTAPLKFTSGTVLGTAEAGAIEFNTDDFFATITTGAARKAFVLDDGSKLTSGKIPVASTNGRLVDGPTWGARQTYTETNVSTDRTFDANATTLDELADVLGTLIADLRAKEMVA